MGALSFQLPRVHCSCPFKSCWVHIDAILICLEGDERSNDGVMFVGWWDVTPPSCLHHSPCAALYGRLNIKAPLRHDGSSFVGEPHSSIDGGRDGRTRQSAIRKKIGGVYYLYSTATILWQVRPGSMTNFSEVSEMRLDERRWSCRAAISLVPLLK